MTQQSVEVRWEILFPIPWWLPACWQEAIRTNPGNDSVQKLSTGDASTLGSYLKLSRAFFGAGSAATQYLERKIAAAPNGAAEEVLADEGQMVYLLGRMHLDGQQSAAAAAASDGQDADPASPALADSEFKKTEPDAWL